MFIITFDNKIVNIDKNIFYSSEDYYYYLYKQLYNLELHYPKQNYSLSDIPIFCLYKNNIPFNINENTKEK